MSNVGCVRATRYIVEILGVYRVVSENDWHRGLIMNISESGVLLQASRPLDLHTHVEMTFQLQEPIGTLHAGLQTCIGEVVRHAEPTRATPFPVGARFVEFRRTA